MTKSQSGYGLLTLLLLAGCTQVVQVGNPASRHCTELGGQVTITRQQDGAEVGLCLFPNGRQCEEWALYRKECDPFKDAP